MIFVLFVSFLFILNAIFCDYILTYMFYCFRKPVYPWRKKTQRLQPIAITKDKPLRTLYPLLLNNYQSVTQLPIFQFGNFLNLTRIMQQKTKLKNKKEIKILQFLNKIRKACTSYESYIMQKSYLDMNGKRYDDTQKWT